MDVPHDGGDLGTVFTAYEGGPRSATRNQIARVGYGMLQYWLSSSVCSLRHTLDDAKFSDH